MSAYLIQQTESFRLANEKEAEAFLEEIKKDKHYTLKKHVSEIKFRKQKGEIVDSWVKLTVVKEFNDEKEPDTEYILTKDEEIYV